MGTLSVKNPFLLKRYLWNRPVLAFPQNEEERVKTRVVNSGVTGQGMKIGIPVSVSVSCIPKENLGPFPTRTTREITGL
jgi:hypothetical protein